MSFIFEPIIFYSLLAGLFVTSMFFAYSIIRQNKERAEYAGRIKKQLVELESTVAQKEREYSLKLSEMATNIKNKEEELKKQIRALEDKLKDKEQLKSDLAKLGEQLKEQTTPQPKTEEKPKEELSPPHQ